MADFRDVECPYCHEMVQVNVGRVVVERRLGAMSHTVVFSPSLFGGAAIEHHCEALYGLAVSGSTGTEA